MSNAIPNTPMEAALMRIRKRIPHEILNMAFFKGEDHKVQDSTNLNTRIREEVLDSLVMMDMNTRGGVAINVDVMSGWMTILNPMLTIVTVPKYATQNRSILNVLNASFGINMINNAAIGIANQSNQPLMAANRAMNSVKPPPYVGTANTRIIGENVVEISNFVSMPVNIRMLVRVAYDKDFLDLRRNYWHKFAELCELAVQSYCHSQLIGSMDRAFLQGGVEMGRLSSKIDEWSGSGETYDDVLREAWGRILILNDPILSYRDTKMKTCPTR